MRSQRTEAVAAAFIARPLTASNAVQRSGGGRMGRRELGQCRPLRSRTPRLPGPLNAMHA